MADRMNDCRFTEEENAIDFLEKAHYFLALTGQIPINWKWVILALHGALYGFAICALKGIHHDHVYKQQNRGCQKRELITLDEAICKCQKPEIMEGFVDSKPFCLTGTQGRSVKKIKEMRNDFIHYIPKIGIIPTENLPRIVNDVLDVIAFLAIDTQTNIHVLKEKEKIGNLVDACKLIVEET